MFVKVSVIVPVYNVAPYLSACLDSLCNQTLKDIEIIVVNDNSTDNSLKILEDFSSKDSRIKIINNNHNQKTAEVRNVGLSIARGEYVSFIDGDDYIDLNFYEKLYSMATKNNADIAKGLTKTINIDGSIVVANDNDNIIKNGKFEFFGHLLTAIYRRSMLKKHNIKFHIDFFCFQIQAVYFANKIVCRNDVFYNYVRHSNSCDSNCFTIEKWQRLNLGHANYIYDWISSHEYRENIKNDYLERIKGLYFYGFNKLAKKDVITACRILAETMKDKYNCGYNTSNIKKLSRKLYRKNKITTQIDYYKNILKGNI